MGTREDSSLLIPTVGLSSLLVDPAIDYITRHGGDVRAGTRINSISQSGQHVHAVRTAAGESLEADVYILAVPFFDLSSIIPDDRIAPSAPLFVSTPIISINLWFDREVFTKEFAAVLNSRIQWIFNRSKLCGPHDGKNGERQHLSLVISGAEEFIEFGKEEIVNFALEDLGRLLPGIRDAKIVHSLVIKEKRATFSPRPGMEPHRPDTRTKLDNAFLAGDWTNTGYPATIEGAVLSGRKAAEAVLTASDRHHTIHR